MMSLPIQRRIVSICFGLAIAVSPSLYGQGWNSTLIDSGRKPSMAIDAEGRLHITYIDEGFNTGFIGYAVVADGTTTLSRITDSTYVQGPAALAIGADGTMALSVHDHRTEGEAVWMFTDTGWVQEQVFDANHDGWDNSIFIGADGLIHTASNDLVDGVEYAVRRSGEWIKESLPTGPIFYRGGTSIFLDGDLPRIAYHNDKTKALEFASFDGVVWDIEVIDPEGIYPSTAFNPRGVYEVAYLSEVEEDVSEVVVASLSNGVWTTEVVDTLRGSLNGASTATSIQLDANGFIHLAYSNRNIVKYAKQIGLGQWDISTVASSTSDVGLIGAMVDMLLTGGGEPRITYFQIPESVMLAIPAPDDTNPNLDMDGDGFEVPEDCDDTNPSINPNAEEILDNDIDENCDGILGVTQGVSVAGRIVDRNGIGIPNVIIDVQGEPTLGTFTDDNGDWVIEDVNETIRVSWDKFGDPRDGLSVQDVLLARNHIIGTIVLDAASQLAADVNQNGSLSVTDMVQITSMILERSDNFTNDKVWMFDPPRLFIDPTAPPTSTQIIGVKLGDTNGSADPRRN